jgi:hypothetical protein
MAQRISSTRVQHPFSFVIVGDSGAWPDPTADAILTALMQQTARRALFHAVQITVTADGAISGRVLQAFDPVDGHARFTFGDQPNA